MKSSLLPSIIAIFLLFLLGCQHNPALPDNSGIAEVNNGFVEPEPSDWVKYTKLVREYMYYRTQAVLNNDIHLLWDRYPDLQENIDHEQGVNAEQFAVASSNQHFKILHANFDIEHNDRIKVKTVNEDEVIVLVHGITVYLRDDFDEFGGEFLIQLFLKQRNHQWLVIKTNEYTLPEYKEWLKNKKNQ